MNVVRHRNGDGDERVRWWWAWWSNLPVGSCTRSLGRLGEGSARVHKPVGVSGLEVDSCGGGKMEGQKNGEWGVLNRAHGGRRSYDTATLVK